MLQHLTRLSRDPSAEGRRTLLNAVTNLFLVEEAPSRAVSDDYAFIAEQALEAISPDDRSVYAESVARCSTLPRTVAMKLASDPEAAVAGVVLALSPVLTDADLASIAVTHSPQHLLAIAKRPVLSSNVTDVLVQRGEAPVLRTVSANDGAEFSEQGISALMQHAENDQGILQNLAKRRELSPEHIERLQRIATELMPTGTAGNAVPFTAERRQAQTRKLEVKILIAEVKRGERSLDDSTRLLATEDRAFDLAQLIGALAGIPDAQVLKALLEPDVSGIAVACRSIGMSEDAFRALLALRRSRLRQQDIQMARDAQAYEDLPNDVSERAMRFVQVRLKLA
jgi:uncharacterized protein (DUF2336 family)